MDKLKFYNCLKILTSDIFPAVLNDIIFEYLLLYDYLQIKYNKNKNLSTEYAFLGLHAEGIFIFQSEKLHKYNFLDDSCNVINLGNLKSEHHVYKVCEFNKLTFLLTLSDHIIVLDNERIINTYKSEHRIYSFIVFSNTLYLRILNSILYIDLDLYLIGIKVFSNYRPTFDTQYYNFYIDDDLLFLNDNKSENYIVIDKNNKISEHKIEICQQSIHYISSELIYYNIYDKYSFKTQIYDKYSTFKKELNLISAPCKSYPICFRIRESTYFVVDYNVYKMEYNFNSVD